MDSQRIRNKPSDPQGVSVSILAKNSSATSAKMAFDKLKTLRAAEKSLEMGKIPAAIKEYCKLVENEPDDFTTLNILGDLYVRVSNQSAAVACFQRIASHYREQDFALKAIAMLKKVDRLQPNNIEVVNQLADLYAQQDLVVDARKHYLILASAHAKAGDARARLEVLCKIADLDPQNAEVRISLAESYLSEGMVNEAVACFTNAGHTLLARNALDDARAAFTKAAEMSANDYAALSGLLATHIARGTADEAAEVIARASEKAPDDVELLSMLASAYIEAEDPQQAEAATNALIEKDSSAYLRRLAVARSYLRMNRVDDAVRVAQSISEQMLAEREEHQLSELVDELLTSDVDNVQALRLLVRLYWWQRDIDNLKAALERLAEAAQAAGLDKDERYALTQLTRLAPDLTQHIERLGELGGAEAEASAEILPEFETPAAANAEVVPQPASEFVIESADSYTTEAEFEYNSAGDASMDHDAQKTERGFTFDATAEVATETDAASVDDRHALMRAQELESVDFYIAQGYSDIAIDTLNLLERQFGSHPDIDSRRQQLGAMNEAPADELAVSAIPASPTLDAAASRQQEHVTFDAPAVQVIDPGLAEIFEEYRESAEAESNGNGDYETHYNLGLAYQEMDLFEEALEEFQIAVGLVSPEDGTPRYLQCCNLLGHCFLQKNVPQLAIKWLTRGLSTPTASEDQRQALRFDLAAAYEQAGELNRAMDLFTEIYGVNVSYRGVNERLRDLQSRIAMQPTA